MYEFLNFHNKMCIKLNVVLSFPKKNLNDLPQFRRKQRTHISSLKIHTIWHWITEVICLRPLFRLNGNNWLNRQSVYLIHWTEDLKIDVVHTIFISNVRIISVEKYNSIIVTKQKRWQDYLVIYIYKVIPNFNLGLLIMRIWPVLP